MEIVEEKSDRRLSVMVLLLIAATAAIVIYTALPERADAQIIGHINQQPVTLERFEAEVRLQQVKDRLSNRFEQEVSTAESLNRMIGDLLLLQGAERADVAVEQVEVDSEVDSVLDRVNSSRPQMKRLLADNKLDWEVFERSIRDYLTLKRFQEDVLLTDVPVGERSAILRDWLSESYQQAEIEFDPEFLDTVNSGGLPSDLVPEG